MIQRCTDLMDKEKMLISAQRADSNSSKSSPSIKMIFTVFKNSGTINSLANSCGDSETSFRVINNAAFLISCEVVFEMRSIKKFTQHD